jgi:hypothetical protein
VGVGVDVGSGAAAETQRLERVELGTGGLRTRETEGFKLLLLLLHSGTRRGETVTAAAVIVLG